MKIKFRTWLWYCRVVGIISLSFLVIASTAPNRWDVAKIILLAIIVIAVGCPGALMPILLRAGVVEFVYTERDKKSFLYRMSRLVVYIEQLNPSTKNLYSKKYLQSFENAKPDESGRNSSDK